MALIEADEIIAEGERLIVAAANGQFRPGALRAWYDAAKTERQRRDSTFRAGDNGGIVMLVGKLYDITIAATHYRRPRPGRKQNETTVLRGWRVEGRAHWSDQFMVVRKITAGKPDYLGATRELRPSAIVDATEVQP